MSTSGKERGLELAVVGVQSEAQEAREESVVYGSEAWFAHVVGLPNWGLDLRKDVNHVSNKDLLFLFEDKVSRKDYSWEQCKSKAVRRMEELYKLLFQVSSMPKDGYVCESFTKAIVSKVLTFTTMNWVLLVEEKWHRKSRNGEVVLYQEREQEQSYKVVVLEKLNS